MQRSQMSSPPKLEDLKLNHEMIMRQRPASVDSGIGLETPDRALSPVSSLGSPIRASTPLPSTPRWVNSVHVWILIVINAEDRSQRLVSKASRILRILLTDQNDNQPRFSRKEDTGPVIFSIFANSTRNTTVGQVQAFDPDEFPNNQFKYYITCGNEGTYFSINGTSGQIFLRKQFPRNWDSEFHLCILASPYLYMLNQESISYDNSDLSMLQVTIRVVRQEDEISKKMKLEAHNKIFVSTLKKMNNSVLTLGSAMKRRKIPLKELAEMERKTKFTIGYKLESVTFRSEMRNETLAESEVDSLFHVSDSAGFVRVSPSVIQRGEGSYQLTITAQDSLERALIYSHVYVVEDVNKLLFVFDMPLEVLEMKYDHFARELKALVSEMSGIYISMDEPKVVNEENRKSGVCFHAAENGVLLNRKRTFFKLRALAIGNSSLSTMYKKYGAITIENCAERLHSAGGPSVPIQYVLFSFAGLLLLLILCTIIAYLCIVQNYKSYMIHKNQYKPVIIPPDTGSETSIPKCLQINEKEYEWKERSVMSQAFG